MKMMVQELRLLLPFKQTTDVGDVILVAVKKPETLQYAVVTKIEPDTSRKEGEWWHLHFTFLSIPLQEVQWTLRIPQMTGAEIFTMGGIEHFVQAVEMNSDELPEFKKPKTKPAFRKVK